jgi:hypothetical protein
LLVICNLLVIPEFTATVILDGGVPTGSDFHHNFSGKKYPQKWSRKTRLAILYSLR